MRAAWLFVLAACGDPHVALRAPAPTSAPDERIAMFHRYEPVSGETVSVSYNHGPYQLESSSIVLSDGTRVANADDLLPVVPDDSDTARAARASAAAGHRSRVWAVIDVVTTAASIAVVSAYMSNNADTGGNSNAPIILIGALIASGVPLLMARHERHEELQLRIQAFTTFTHDLGMRLDVCAHGLEVVPCDAPQPLQPPGMTPGPTAPTAPPATTVPDRTGLRESVLLGRDVAAVELGALERVDRR
jgi:hypothetical protein